METKVVKHRELIVAILDDSPYQATGEVYKRAVKIELTEEQAQKIALSHWNGNQKEWITSVHLVEL
jgi:hypothetical protein